MKVSEVLIDPATGVHVNAMKPRDFILYNKLDKLRLGFLISFKLSAEQKKIIEAWNSRFMQENPADVFFAPSADDIVRTRAAFGCSHYARAFMAVVKALGIMDAPEDLRYTVSSKADSYNEALEAGDTGMTIHGHQFVLARVENSWVAVNTSKGKWTAMPQGFSPEGVRPPHNIPVPVRVLSGHHVSPPKGGQGPPR